MTREGAEGATQDWDPDLYRRFEDERTRPARDLLERVALVQAKAVFDLGCGPGNSTGLLAARFGAEAVTGLDASEAMLVAARERLPGCRFIGGDVTHFAPPSAPDLLFANALLQWVPGHDSLFRRLFAVLAPQGALAVQMPDNREEPSHRLMAEVARRGPWATTIGDAGAARARIIQPLEAYYDMLSGQAASVDVWRTLYHHPMDSAAAIVSWLRSTGLKPFVDPLPAAQQQDFLDAYEQAIEAAYPARADGRRLLTFPRVFIVAHKAA